MKMREDNFEFQVREIVQNFTKDFAESIQENNGDVNETIWENVDEFGRIAIEAIWQSLGDDFVSDVAKEALEALNEEDEEESF